MNRTARRQQMISLLARRDREGLSYRALEELTGISRNTFAFWASKLRSESDIHEAPKPGRFVELVAADDSPAAESPIEIVIGDRVIRVRRGFDAPTLSRVLSTIATPC
jgi:predicted transcriptional regulator